MAELRIALNNIAPEGKTFVMDDPAIWSVPMTECGMDCRVVQPLVGTVTLLPQEDGCLVRGNLKGEVVVPCNRCAEDAHLIIDSSFDSFEPFPQRTTRRSRATAKKSRSTARPTSSSSSWWTARRRSIWPACSGKSLCSPFRYVLCASLIARGCAPTAGKTLTKVLAPACGTKAIPVLRPSGV